MRRTKIIATVGPSSMTREILKKMRESGMDIVRINLSHGDIDQYKKIIDTVNKVDKNIPIFFDTQGPEIRLITNGEIVVEKGDVLKLGDVCSFNVDVDDLKDGKSVLVNEGILRFKYEGGKLIAKNSGILTGRSRVNIPEYDLKQNILTKNDKVYLDYAEKSGVSYVALSYVKNRLEVLAVKKNYPNLGIISKIENQEGVDNIDEIIEVSDGVMIARGDLGTEIKPEKLPMIQKEIIRRCNQKGKFVITATQMLQSMIVNPTPTRAETSDVANAILDGTDCVMLSGETAIGTYPDKAIKMMDKIAMEVEGHAETHICLEKNSPVSEAISKSIYEMAEILPIDKIVTFTRSGYTAAIISRFRLDVPIIAITPAEEVSKKVSYYFGVQSIVFEQMELRKRIVEATKRLIKEGLLKKSDLVLYTAGVFASRPGMTNLIEIHKVDELLNKD